MNDDYIPPRHARALGWQPITAVAGSRVELVHCTDEHTRLEPGARGTVSFVDDLGTIHVDWDDGHRLGMVLEAGDRINLIGEESV